MSTGMTDFRREAYTSTAKPADDTSRSINPNRSGRPLGGFGGLPDGDEGRIYLFLPHVAIDEHLLDVIPGRKVVHGVEEDFFHDRP